MDRPLGVGRPLGVDDLSRRPSSTSSANIYLDVLGEPTAYTNDDTAQDNGQSTHYTNTRTDIYNQPDHDSTHPAHTSGTGTALVQDYVDMDAQAAKNDVITTDDVSLHSADYDDAWCTVPAFPEQHRLSPPESPTSMSPQPGATTTIPTITIQDESGVSLDCAYHVCDLNNTSRDEEHIYDVIRDSDVED
ncbi:uncharacterized protein LOC143291533 [Babylonia areolata]|uniref:uncharacterized protein LOC143291533 n=1 Tax=Babylonia areolata TaxID=304850 RepID=UPI003FD16679